MRVEILDFGSVERVARKLTRTAQSARPVPMRRAFNRIETEMRLSVRSQFRTRGRRGATSWANLKEDTVRKKGNSKILYTKGANPDYSDLGNDALFRSFTIRSDPDHIYEVTGYIMEFGSANPHAALMQDGAPGRNIPARPMMRFTKVDRVRWKEIISARLMEVWMK